MMRRELTGKRAIITGASSGIGQALARELAGRGTRLVLAARRDDALTQLAHELDPTGQNVVPCATDVTKPQDRERLVHTALEKLGGLDLLINNAGIGAQGHFIDLDSNVLRDIFEVNFFAYAEMCRLAIPHLKSGQQPLIVNMGSMAGRRGVPAWTEYSASKFAVSGFSEALRPELARFDIDLLLVIAGLTRTGLPTNLLQQKGKMPIDKMKGIEPAQVAQQMVKAIQRNKREVWIERNAKLMLWVNKFFPNFVERKMARLIRRLYADEIAQRKNESKTQENSTNTDDPASQPASPQVVQEV